MVSGTREGGFGLTASSLLRDAPALAAFITSHVAFFKTAVTELKRTHKAGMAIWWYLLDFLGMPPSPTALEPTLHIIANVLSPELEQELIDFW